MKILVLISLISSMSFADQRKVDLLFDQAEQQIALDAELAKRLDTIRYGGKGAYCKSDDSCPTGSECQGYVEHSRMGQCFCYTKGGCSDE